MKHPKFTLFTSRRRGLSLTELVIVLGISSLLIGGSFAWFSSQRTVNFYDQMRQIESRVRKVQSDSQTNIVPGFSPGGACNDRTNPGCVLTEGEQVFGTAISVENQAAASPTKVRIYYLESTNPDDSLYKRADSVVPYGPAVNYSEDVTLPTDMRFLGYRVYGHRFNIATGTYDCRLADAALIKWPLPTTADGQNDPVPQTILRK